MNLVKDILGQLSGQSLDDLSSMLDTDAETAGNAARAATPALLAGLASLASQGDGLRKLTGVLGQFGAGGEDSFSNMLGGDPGSVAQKGASLLNNLFGDSMLSGLTSSISRYAGLASGSVKGLLAFLAPMVLSKVASMWKGQGGTPQALTNLFASQRENIADALPAGFSLASIPGYQPAKETVRAAAATGRHAVAAGEHATRSIASWAVPLALCLLGGFLLWNWMRDRDAVADRAEPADKVTVMKPVTPAAPDAVKGEDPLQRSGAAALDPTALNKKLHALYASAEKTLAGITDAASAEAARPELQELAAQIDATRQLLVKLPASQLEAAKEMADEGIESFKTQAEKTLETPGLSDQIKTLISTIARALSELFTPATP